MSEDAEINLDESDDSSVFEMSDDEFARLDLSAVEELSTLDSSEESEDEQTEDSEEQLEVADDTEESDSSDSGIVGDADSSAPVDSNDISDADASDVQDDTDAVSKDKEPFTKVNHKNFYEAITAPFKANGKQMQVDNVEDVVRLMQMGANYNRKMAGLKPGMKILKTLEKNKIDEGKLNFLIDLDRKDPAAIARLVKESGIDPIEMDLDTSYTQSNYEIGDSEMALEQVIDDIRDSDTYSRTLDIVGSNWDSKSREAVADSPELLRDINTQVGNGVYDVISTEVDRARALGQLMGLTDIAAYHQVGQALQARGGFDHLFPQQRPQTPPTQKANTQKPESANDQKLKTKRRAASTPKTATTATNSDYNPLAMSDEEFLKQADTMKM